MQQQMKPELSFTTSLVTDRKAPSQSRYTFEEVFSEAVDLAFSTLGNKAKQTLICYMEQKLGVEQCAIGSDLEAFSGALEEVFGQATQLIEVQIMHFLHMKVPRFEYAATGSELSFLNYVKAFRRFV